MPHLQTSHSIILFVRPNHHHTRLTIINSKYECSGGDDRRKESPPLNILLAAIVCFQHIPQYSRHGQQHTHTTRVSQSLAILEHQLWLKCCISELFIVSMSNEVTVIKFLDLQSTYDLLAYHRGPPCWLLSRRN